MRKVFSYGVDSKDKLVNIVNLIPSNWLVIQGTLKAPMRLKNLSDIHLQLSGRNHSIPAYGTARIQQRLELEGERLFEFIKKKMNPIEVIFEWYLEENFEDIKSELKKYLELGYQGVVRVNEKQIKKGYFTGTGFLLDSRKGRNACSKEGLIYLIGNIKDKSFRLLNESLINLNLRLIEEYNDTENKYR